MTNNQLAAFIIGVAITVVIVGAVLVVLYALRGFRNSRTAADSTQDSSTGRNVAALAN